MKGRFHILSFAGLLLRMRLRPPCFPGNAPPQAGVDVNTPEAGGEHLRMETQHGPLNLWRPADYDAQRPGS